MTRHDLAKLVVFCFQKIDPDRFRNIDWATVYSLIDEYEGSQDGGVNLQKGGTP